MGMGVTPHRCNAVPGQYISQCHQRGCQSNVFLEDPKAYCPDASCKIDTSRPFRVFQLWGSDHATMEWLDEETGCKGDCVPGETEVSFSNLAIRSLAKSVEDEVIIF